jgi:hypothetical protein
MELLKKNYSILSKLFLVLLLVILFLFSLFQLEQNIKIEANSPICIPPSCPTDYEPDFNCIQKQILDPTAKNPSSAQFCCENKCKDIGGLPTEDRARQLDPLFTFFGQTLYVSVAERIPTLINLAITTALGLMSVYTVVYGTYVAGYKRTQTTDPGEIEKISKTLKNLVLGFVLAWSFIFIIQLVASLLGLGSLSNLTLVGDGGGSTITIE